MAFSYRVSKGLRVSVGARGVRAHVGPRGARFHVGGGPTGFSTGAGRFSYYTSLGSSSLGSSSSAKSTSSASGTAAAKAAFAKATKAALANELSDFWLALFELHRVEFNETTKPTVAAPPEPDLLTFLAVREQDARSNTSFFARSRRKAALDAARELAQADYQGVVDQNSAQVAAQQQEIDEWWAKLQRCDPDTVLNALAQAFEDNEAPASAVGVREREVSLVVLVPSPEALPDRIPGTTAAGNLSVKKLTKTEATDFYKILVISSMITTIKEAFAVAPQLESARIVAVRSGAKNAYGNRRVEAIAAGLVYRSAFEGVRWDEVDASQVFNDCFAERMANQVGRLNEFQPMDLSDDPDIQELIDAIDLDDLENGNTGNVAKST